MPASSEINGLTASLDRLVYHRGGAALPEDKPHAFVYYVTIKNNSPRTVILHGRKWIIRQADGTQLVLEGDKIVGETPRLQPGEQFSYNSYHVTGGPATVDGSFHGIDEQGHRVHVRLPAFSLEIPSP